MTNDQVDFGGLAQRARQMRGEVAGVQGELARMQATGHGGQGMVTATVAGNGRLIALDIDPSVIDPDDPQTLSELIMEAVENANQTIVEARTERLRTVTEDLGSMLNGLRNRNAAGGTVLPRFGPPDRKHR